MKKWLIRIPIGIILLSVLMALFMTPSATNPNSTPDKKEPKQSASDTPSSASWISDPSKLEKDDLQNSHIVKCLTESYGLPKAEIEKLLAASGGTPNEKFRKELFYKFGVATPTDWGRLPRWPRAVPIGTTIEYTFRLKPGETSQVFAMLGVWAITIEPTDWRMSRDLDYILDPGQPYGKTVQYRPLPTKQNRYLDPATGKEVDGAARNTYQVALPQGYALPAGKDEVEFKVIMVRERNPDFNE